MRKMYGQTTLKVGKYFIKIKHATKNTIYLFKTKIKIRFDY